MRLILPVLAAFTLAIGTASAQQSLSNAVPSVDQRTMPDSFSQLSKRLMPAVVNITTSQVIAPDLPDFPDGSPLERFNPFFGRDPEGYSQQGSLGSGFITSPDGIVITNHHVIKGADEVNVVFQDGRTIEAEIVGIDPETDIAVLKIAQEDPLPFVNFANSDAAEVGDWVMAIGNPFGFGGSVSVGIVSARNRELNSGNYDNYIQTDAAINSGNSGGPLFNLNGEVLGVNTAIITPTGGSVGLGFSIPSNLVKQISDQILEFGEARRGWFGVTVQGVDEDIARAYGVEGADGVIITTIDPEGPAAAADIEVGDLVRTFDGKPIKGVRNLSLVVAQSEIGKDVDVELVRDGRRKTISLQLAERETAEEAQKEKPPVTESSLTDNPMGVDFTEMNEAARRRYGIPSDIEGVLVRSVSPNGPSFGKLQKGDVVIEMGFETIEDPTAALIAMDKAAKSPDTPLLIRVYRRQNTMFFPIEMGAQG